MKRSMKAALISSILVLLFGATALGFIGSQSAVANHDSPANNRPPDNRPTATRGLTGADLRLIKEMLEERNDNLTRLEMLKELLANATTVQINGTVVAIVKNMLILNTTMGHETILLPRVWTVNATVMQRARLFNGTFSGVGQEVKVMALKLIVFENQNVIINVLFGFEITNANSVTAFALLPFNIETKT